MQGAEEVLLRARAAGAAPDAGAITHVQVLEMAVAEAERRMADAQRCAPGCLIPTNRSSVVYNQMHVMAKKVGACQPATL